MLQVFNYNAGKGDCIRLRYTGLAGTPHNILIDSGVIRFGLEFEAICRQIVVNHEKIDVMILSHVDTDHLGGLLYNLRNKTKLNIQEVWMNHGKLMGKNTDLSVRQNDEVYTVLKEQGVPIKPALAGMVYDLDGATFRILWPDEEILYQLFPKVPGNVPLGRQSDYGYSLEALMDLPMKGKDAKNIGYEYDEIKSFDDIVIFYKKGQTFRNTTIDRVYIQVKFHMKQNKEFTIENLLDPSFIDAKSESFLQKVVNAYRKDKEQYSKSVYVIY